MTVAKRGKLLNHATPLQNNVLYSTVDSFNLNMQALKAEVGIRDKGFRDPASRSRIFGTETEFLMRATDRDRVSRPGTGGGTQNCKKRDPGQDAEQKIEKKRDPGRDAGQDIFDTGTSGPY